ncbi:MAG: SusC/RagA family TonB-linked outer membrane protein, partial [Bacteroidota bacterium]
HRVTAMSGSSIQRSRTNDSYMQGNDFPSNVDVKTLNAANLITAYTGIQEWALVSFFGRATYDYASKYYLTFTVREDGSSKLTHKWGTMPSFSLAWRVSGESFWKKIKLINDLKIRGGWGKVGNQEGIPNYAPYGLFDYYRRAATNPLSGPGLVQSTLGNPFLKWETTNQTNVGIDLSMLDSRIVLTADAYYKITSDVLLMVQLPTIYAVSKIMTNAGKVENKGIEFNLNSVNLDSKLKWNTNFNISFNRNVMKELNYTSVYFYSTIYSNNQDLSIVKAGLPLGTFYGYIAEGVDPKTGMEKYADLNGNGQIDPSDRPVIGPAQPKYTFGITNTFNFWRFDLSLFVQGSYGNQIFNATRIDLEGMFDSKNQSVSVLNRWTPTNTITDIPKAGGGLMGNVRNSTRFVEDGSYVRLKSVTLSYKVFENKKKIKGAPKLSLYVTAQNLLTLTKYTGYDPEVSAYGQSAVEMGIDYGTYPQAVTFITGINLEF